MEVMHRGARNCPKTWPMGPRWTHQDKPFIPLNLSHQTMFLLLSGMLTFHDFPAGQISAMRGAVPNPSKGRQSLATLPGLSWELSQPKKKDPG